LAALEAHEVVFVVEISIVNFYELLVLNNSVALLTGLIVNFKVASSAEVANPVNSLLVLKSTSVE
jgi:hypothetical protein